MANLKLNPDHPDGEDQTPYITGLYNNGAFIPLPS